MSLPRFQPISREAFADLMSRAEAGDVGEDYALACNASPQSDHVHVRRIGAEGSLLNGRVLLFTHGEEGEDVATVYIAAHEARMLAAALLNMADELDGVTPLVFTPGITSNFEGEGGEE